MIKVLRYSPLILFLVAFPISFFYSPNLPTYVLGNLRESVGAWAVTSYLLTITLGVLAVANYKGWMNGRFVLWILLIDLIGLVALHHVPILLYWHVIQSDGIIRDDTANPVVQANILMFIWHIGITMGSILVGLIALLHSTTNKLPESKS